MVRVFETVINCGVALDKIKKQKSGGIRVLHYFGV